MEMFLFLVVAGFFAGTMNAVAGGGSFISLPAMVFAGVPPVTANASTTVAVFPGTVASAVAYWPDMKPLSGVSMRALTILSLIGGLVGALLLLWTPPPAFDQILPWLLLVATLAFAFGKHIGERLRSRFLIGREVLLVLQFVLAVYGGYFGGGVGIMMLAAWSLFVTSDVKTINPLRVTLVAAMNAVAVVCFIIAGQVSWFETVAVLIGAVLGGYLGARVARRADPRLLRAIILAVAASMTVVFFIRAAA